MAPSQVQEALDRAGIVPGPAGAVGENDAYDVGPGGGDGGDSLGGVVLEPVVREADAPHYEGLPIAV